MSNVANGTNFLKFGDDHLSSEALSKAKEDINETEETKEAGMKVLRDKLIDIRETKNIQPCFDDDFLIRFLRVSWFDIPYAVDRLNKYYSIIRKNPKFFKDSFISAMEKSKHLRHLSFGPYRLKDNSVLLVVRYGLFNPSVVSFEESFILSALAINLALGNPVTQMCGMTSICDFSGLSLQTILAHTPRNLRIHMEFLCNTQPLLGKSTHLINTSSLFQTFYGLFEKVLTKDMKIKIIVHPTGENWKSLHSHISPEVLPEDFGGQVPLSEMINPFENLSLLEEEYRKYFTI